MSKKASNAYKTRSNALELVNQQRRAANNTRSNFARKEASNAAKARTNAISNKIKSNQSALEQKRKTLNKKALERNIQQRKMLETSVEKIKEKRQQKDEQKAKLELEQLDKKRSQDFARNLQLEKTKLLQQKTSEAANAAEERARIIREARKERGNRHASSRNILEKAGQPVDPIVSSKPSVSNTSSLSSTPIVQQPVKRAPMNINKSMIAMSGRQTNQPIVNPYGQPIVNRDGQSIVNTST